MGLLIHILIALIVVGCLLWGISAVLGVSKIPEPVKTIIWVISVLIAVIVFLNLSGLYHLAIT